MCKWYKEMNCYIITSEHPPSNNKIDKITQKAILEQSFRNYAAIFDKVKIVITPSQAKEHFLNFPRILQNENLQHSHILNSLIADATSEAIFVGHSDFYDFPISFVANLLKSYKGELFMGYKSYKLKPQQPLFGIFHKKLISQTQKIPTVDLLEKDSYRLLPLPESMALLF